MGNIKLIYFIIDMYPRVNILHILDVETVFFFFFFSKFIAIGEYVGIIIVKS